MSRRLDNYRTQLQQGIEHIAGTLNLPAGHPSQCRVILLLLESPCRRQRRAGAAIHRPKTAER